MKKLKIAIIGLTGQSIFMNVDEFHKNGETKHANNLHIEPGGKGYNQAIACARLGAEVHYLTSVGNDEYGKICEKVMENEGIKTYYIIKEENTALATIITNDHGDNQVTVYKGASSSLNVEDLDEFKNVIKQCDVLLIQNEIPFTVLKEAIQCAKDSNVYVVYNPAPAIYDISMLFDNIYLLIPNEQEAIKIFGSIYDIEYNYSMKTIITLGSKGALYIDQNIQKTYPSLKVNVLDTTGAGDVFCAAVATQIKSKKTIDEIIRFATIASSLHIQEKYVINAIPSIDKVNKIYNKEEV